MSYRDERTVLRQRILALQAADKAQAPKLAEAKENAATHTARRDELEEEQRGLRRRRGIREFGAGVAAITLVLVCAAASLWLTYLGTQTERTVVATTWVDGRSGERHQERCVAELVDPFWGDSRARVSCAHAGVIYDGPMNVRNRDFEFWHHGNPACVWVERYGRIIVRRDTDIFVIGTRGF